MRKCDRLRFQRLYMFAARIVQSATRRYLSQKALSVISLVDLYSEKVERIQR